MERNNKWVELLVFIHGVSPEAEPKSHSDTYGKIKRLLDNELGNRKFDDDHIIEIEWGWQGAQEKYALTDLDSYLAVAERGISNEVREATLAANDTILGIFRRGRGKLKRTFIKLREFFLYGPADLFYYAGQDGEQSVRNSVFAAISDNIVKRESLEDPDKKFSITIIAHSAGSVIVHDLLWWLYGKRENPGWEEEDVNELATAALIRLNRIRELIDDKRFRVKRFYTIGSPITPLALRSHRLIANILVGDKADPEEIGFYVEDNLENPRWINIWDVDDLFAYPVEFLYKGRKNDKGVVQKVVEDRCVNIGNLFIPIKNCWLFFWWKGSDVHNLYWESKKVAKTIADNWKKDSD